jgi:hypothetical protein
MNDWIDKIEPKIRKFYHDNIGNPDELVLFRTNNRDECEIVKKDGSHTTIHKKIIDAFEDNERAKKDLLQKLKKFRFSPMQWLV